MSPQTQVQRCSKNVLQSFKSILLFYWDCRQPFRWGCASSKIMAISSLFYLHPMYLLRPFAMWESNLWLLVTFCSLLSDYFFIGQRHSPLVRGVHLTDRWVASIALAIQIFYNIPYWFSESILLAASGSFILTCAVATKVKGSMATTTDSFTFWHIMWHAVSAFGRSFQGWLQYKVYKND